MNRRLLGLAAIAVALALAAFFLGRRGGVDFPSAPASSAGTRAGPGATQLAGSPAPGVVASGAPAPDAARAQPAELVAGEVRVIPGAREMASGLNNPAHSPEKDLEILDEVLAQFRHIFGQNPPGGLNAEIVAGLIGGNAKKLAVLPPDLPALNERGEVVDRWGTPFYFHPVSGEVMEIVSAGPDLVLWTQDDVGVVHPVDAL